MLPTILLKAKIVINLY